MQQTNMNPQKAKRVACKECRQAKARTPDQWDQPMHKMPQAVTAVKIDELTEQVEQLRSAVDRRGVDTSNSSIPAGNSGPPSSHHDSSHLQTSTSHAQRPMLPPQPSPSLQYHSRASKTPPVTPTTFSGAPLAIHSRSLEHINLDQARIDDLYRIFFQHYHPFFDILDITVAPDEFYSRSPLLFWAIIAIASRQYPQDATLFSILYPCVTKLMWTSISTFPHTRYIVQAILLLSVWSFPANSMSTDPAFILVSIAKSISMQLGIHRPEIIQDFVRVKTQLNSLEFRDAVQTWAGAFIAAQSVTTSIGQSTVLHADWVIEAACEQNSKYTLPDNLRHHLLISKFFTRINCLMAENKHLKTSHPLDREICILVNVLEQDFIELKLRIGQSLSGMMYKVSYARLRSDRGTEIHQILLEMSALQLRTYYFFISSDHDLRREGLLKAYTTSLDLICKATEAKEKSDFIRYAPDVYGRFLVLAAVLVMRIIHSSYARYVDVNEGKSAFDAVLRMFQRASLENDDLRGRISKILKQLWSFHQSCAPKSILEEPKLHIRTRLGASLLHDALWTWREEFGGQKGAVRTLGPATSVQNVLGNAEHTSRSIPNINPADPENMDSQTLQQRQLDLESRYGLVMGCRLSVILTNGFQFM
ncbi:Regulatory LEU3 [Hyphodiscus hymeniophilus]|uniref:Regulatory LEU3 n=1 Tax=Hyphodiscus hymeniophilus TaxID=353542 RepID=A0A9P6VIX4_9HELO|nr:Regulatory LEU3 [Hyphodiscus hymeniophilus]